nr:hypothetical protein [Tanacetum cinerariifolium]
QTKDLHTADYTQLYDFLKYNQKEVDEVKAERIAKIQDPLALMANSNNPYASPAPHQDLSPFNQNYMQQPIPNPEDITDPTTAMNMALTLMVKHSSQTTQHQPTTIRGFHQTQGTGRLLNREEAGIQLQAEEYDLMAAVADLDEIEEVNANCILMANLQQASSSDTHNESAEVHENCDNNEIFKMFTQEEQYTELLETILESYQVPQNDNDVISEDTSME